MRILMIPVIAIVGFWIYLPTKYFPIFVIGISEEGSFSDCAIRWIIDEILEKKSFVSLWQQQNNFCHLTTDNFLIFFILWNFKKTKAAEKNNIRFYINSFNSKLS